MNTIKATQSFYDIKLTFKDLVTKNFMLHDWFLKKIRQVRMMDSLIEDNNNWLSVVQSIWGLLNFRIQQRLLPPTPIDMIDEYYKKISMAELIFAIYSDNLATTKTSSISHLYGNNYWYGFFRDQANKYIGDQWGTDRREGDRREGNRQEDDRHGGDHQEDNRRGGDHRKGDHRDIWKQNDHE